MTAAATTPRSFAEAVEPAHLTESRRELVREAAHWLDEYERRRRDEDRGRLLQTLELLALLVRAEPSGEDLRDAFATSTRDG